ncbi:MAG: PAS domain-containing sensor histidine kinase [Pseudomonadota bacterium]
MKNCQHLAEDLLAALPDALVLVQAGRLTWCNPAGRRLLGGAAADQDEAQDLARLLPPECLAWLAGTVDDSLQETRLHRLDGRELDVEIRATVLAGGAGERLLVVRPTPPARRRLRLERAIGQITQALIQATDVPAFLEAVCRILAEEGTYPLVWIGVADAGAEGGCLLAARAHDGRVDPLSLGVLWQPAVPSEGDPEVMPPGVGVAPLGSGTMPVDATAGPDWRCVAAALGCTASATLRLVDGWGESKDVLVLCSREADPFPEAERLQMAELSGELAFGLRSLRLRTAHAETESAMHALRHEFQQILEWQVASQTAAAIAHEIGQPLSAVTTFGEAALRLLDDIQPRPDRLARAVEGMAVQAERAGHVVRELMDFLRHAEGSQEVVDPLDLLQGVAPLVRASQGAHLAIDLVAPAGLGPVWANRLQIEKVLLNLLRNAADALEAAGQRGRDFRVAVEMSQNESHLRLCVVDRGPGVDPAIAGRVFEPFFTTKTRGIGMGLALSRALVEGQGGRLWHEPETGGGARFCFSLPLGRTGA